MLLTEAILSRTKGRTNYVLEKEINYSDGIPSLIFKNTITDTIIDFYMEYYMTPCVRLLEYNNIKDIIAMKSNQNYFFNTIRSLEKETQRKNEFVILGSDYSSQGLPCLGIVGITENYVYLKTKATESHKFNYPKEFYFDKTSRCTAVFAASLISILLANAGFLIAGDVLYRNSNPDYKSDLPSYCFCGRRVFNCFETDAVLTSADIFQIDK